MSKIIKKIDFLLRALLIVKVTIFFALQEIVQRKIFKQMNKSYQNARNWSSILLTLCGAKLNIKYETEIDKEQSYIYVSNHSSLYDIPTATFAIKDDIRIIYKKELEKIPIFGYCLKVMPYIAIKRENPKEARAGLDEAIAAFRENASILIFPEGTRSETGELGEFKRGAFLLAKESGKKIVPVGISGTKDILPKGSLQFNKGDVFVRIGKPIEYKQDMNRVEEKSFINDLRNEIIRLKSEK